LYALAWRTIIGDEDAPIDRMYFEEYEEQTAFYMRNLKKTWAVIGEDKETGGMPIAKLNEIC